MTTETTTIDLSKLSAKTRRAVTKYGLTTCIDAFKHNRAGEGPSNIACYLNLSGVNVANAAINAGREIETGVKPQSPKREKPHNFLYTIELHTWKPEKANEPCTNHRIMGGADDQQIAWEFARAILRMAPNTDAASFYILVNNVKRHVRDSDLG